MEKEQISISQTSDVTSVATWGDGPKKNEAMLQDAKKTLQEPALPQSIEYRYPYKEALSGLSCELYVVPKMKVKTISSRPSISHASLRLHGNV